MDKNSLNAFIKAINAEHDTGKASERSYYAALEALLEAASPEINAQVESTGDTAGIPDLKVARRANWIGHIEVKDPAAVFSLKDIEDAAREGKSDSNSVQFNRYLAAHGNLIYTNLLNWRRYREHSPIPVQIATPVVPGPDGRFHLNSGDYDLFCQMLDAFLSAQPECQTTAAGLAAEMAKLTRILRDNAGKLLDAKNPFLLGLLEAFKQELIKDISNADFADMYAETVAYGLFTARFMQPATPKLFTRHEAAQLIPRANPFLRQVFKSLVDDDNMPAELKWVIDDLTDLINAANMGAIGNELAAYGQKRSQHQAIVEHDPIIYFYENFLHQYDPAKAKKRGVYYTPLPVVSYIVRSLDKLLQTEFDMPLGLADDRVVILDPACGTGTFLYEVIRLIYDRIAPRGTAAWRECARKLIKRLFGFELLMAPYTICHLKLEELFKEFDYTLGDDERLGVYLTNTLEEAESHVPRMPLGIYGAIEEERAAADRVKSVEPVMVVLGNPPYSVNSSNKGKWITDLVRDEYYPHDDKKEQNPKLLLDDYVKFLRWAQWRIESTGKGIVGMITNHGYFDSPTFRRMRQSLMASFNNIHLLDLHGNLKKKERAEDGSKDVNVFDIELGVAIGLWMRGAKEKAFFVSEIYGLRQLKYKILSEYDCLDIDKYKIEPTVPFYTFRRMNELNIGEYYKYHSFSEIFTYSSSGIKTHRDHFAYSYNITELESRLKELVNRSISDDEILNKYRLENTTSWSLTKSREDLYKCNNYNMLIHRCIYKPFDMRYVFYSIYLCDRPRHEVLDNFLSENIGLIIGRAGQVIGSDVWNIIFCTTCLTDVNLFRRGGNAIFPLYLYPEEGQRLFADGATRHPNISPEFIKALESHLNIKFNPVVAQGIAPLPKSGSDPATVGVRHALPLPSESTPPTEFSPEDVFFYIYSVLHAPTYRTRYAEFLRIDFPRIPLPPNPELFFALGKWGAELVRLHLLRDSSNWDWEGVHAKGDNLTVGKVDYSAATEEIILDAGKPMDEQLRIGPVPLHIWEFQIGGCQVLRHWLKERKGRKIELGEFVPIIIALRHTDRIMREEIDPLFGQLLVKVGQGA